MDATCRMTTPDGSRGTGCVFEIRQGQVYVLTAAHVVDKYLQVACEFWRDGHQSVPLQGQVIARVENQQTDAAIVAINAALFGPTLPAVIPVAPPETVLSPGETIASVGCAHGNWSTGWKGHVLGYQGTDLTFVPAPADGRSGSALFDAQGKTIIGIVRARTLDNGMGIASGLQALYRDLGRAPECRTQCGPQCGPNGCSTSWSLGLRAQPQQPWPTMPPQPSVDLSPIANRMDRLADAVADLRPIPQSAAVVTPDPATIQAIQQLGQGLQQQGQEIGQIKAAIPQAIHGAIAPLAERITGVESAIRPLATIREKLDADIEAGGLRGKIAQRIEDRLDDPTAWIKHAGIALAVVLVIALAVGIIHAIHAHATKTGNPTLLEKAFADLKTKVDTAAAVNPALAPADLLVNLIATKLATPAATTANNGQTTNS
jgi:hypothetical protein